MILRKRQIFNIASIGVAVLALASNAHAAKTAEELTVALDTIWVVLDRLAGVLHEPRLRARSSPASADRKNTVNILSKNFIVFAISCLAFYVFGWGLMFGNGSGLVGTEGLLTIGGADNSPATGDAYTGAYKAIAWTGIPLYAKFFFQLVFAGTAATIVSGAVAERIKYFSFIVFSFLLVAFVYPVTGHWIWGGGWLATAGFWDFAGSTVVHSVGGWAALAGILVLGPALRQVRRRRQGQPDSRPQHDLGRHRLLRALARLVRFQPRLDDGGRSERHRAHLHDHQHGGLHGAALGDRARTGCGTASRISACRSTAASPAWSRSPRRAPS